MELDKTQLQWLVAGVGAVIVVLIYLWGIRARVKDELRQRRRQPSLGNEPVFGEDPDGAPEAEKVHNFGHLGRITPDHHLADKVLVDVEIHPIERGSADPDAEVLNASSVEVTPVADPPLTVPAAPETAAPATPVKPAMPDTLRMTVALTVVAPPGQLFTGMRIQTVAAAAHLRLDAASGLFERRTDEGAAGRDLVFAMAHLRKPGAFDVDTLSQLRTPGLLLFMNLPGPLEDMQALDLMVLAADQLARELGGSICDERRSRMTNQALLQLRSKVADLSQRRQAQSC